MLVWTVGHPSVCVAQDLKLAIHIHSTVSTGSLEPADVVTSAREAGLDGVIFTDSFLRRWEYGVWPVRSMFKWTVEQPSVVTFGAARYLDTIQRLNHSDGPLAIAGVEPASFYYWHRSPFDRRGGQMRGWSQHLLVFGVRDPAALAQLPVLAMDAYHGNQGAKPHQQVIDAVNRIGGLVFWAHPAAAARLERFGSAESYTEPYPHLLELTHGYQGFAVGDIAQAVLLEPGAMWDRLLMAYCQGQRSEPVWVLGELDWRNPNERPLDHMLTIVSAAAKTEDAVLEAIRKGRMWVVMQAHGHAPTLTMWQIAATGSDRYASSGASVQSAEAVRIQVAATRDMPSASAGAAHVMLIRDGQIHDERTVESGEIALEWTQPAPTTRSFYRVIIRDAAGMLYTNPIFVEPSGL